MWHEDGQNCNSSDSERESPAQKMAGAEMGVWGAPKELQFMWTYIKQ